jgi:integrase/recombinase XerD
VDGVDSVEKRAVRPLADVCGYSAAMAAVRSGRYPLLKQFPRAQAWLAIQANLGRADNTIDAYGRGLHDFLSFASAHQFVVETVGREGIALYVRDLMERPNPRGANLRILDSGVGLANATLLQRLTVIRLFFDYLVEEGTRATNPVGRGRRALGRGTGQRGLVPRYQRLPWIPDDDQWRQILNAVRQETMRNRVMMAFAYDAALRREELCLLETGDIDPSARLLRIRAETTKGRRERVVPYSAATDGLYAAYLRQRRTLSRARGPLFLSESSRNRGEGISPWTWSKVVQRIATQAGVQRLSTHTFRHLCLTDLARSGWDLHEIAQFAGHRNTETTLQYVHLSGRELSRKLERGMAAIHAWRTAMVAETLA